jgi:hypothetical protein
MTQNDKVSASIIYQTWKSPSLRKQNVNQMPSPSKFEKKLCMSNAKPKQVQEKIMHVKCQAQLQASSQSRMILSNAQQFS